MLILMTKVQLHLNSGLCESSACYHGTDHVEQNPQLHSACMCVRNVVTTLERVSGVAQNGLLFIEG